MRFGLKVNPAGWDDASVWAGVADQLENQATELAVG